MDSYGISDVGLVRSSNQDRFLIRKKPGKFHQDMLAIVCDGIGGAKAGDVASEQTIALLDEAFQSVGTFKNSNELEGWLYQQIRSVNDKIFSMAITSEKYSGMGTTLVGCLMHDNICRIAHVGDSRAYVLQNDEFSLLTEDHTYMNELLRQGELSKLEVYQHPKRNYLTNAVGVFNQIRIDMISLDAKFDLLLLCSDGLHGVISSNKIQVILRQPWSAKAKCEMLIDVAKQFGGVDNITVIVLQKEEMAK